MSKWMPSPPPREVLVSRNMLDSPRVGHKDVLQRALDGGFSLQETLDEVARHYLARAHEEAGGVKSKASELLGFANYQTYDNWRRRYLGDR